MALQPSSKSTIPADIWMHVAQFIPHTDLCSMFSINRIFFQLSMNARYRDLTFDAYSHTEALPRRLQRVRDPSVSHRVRHLYIKLKYGLRHFNKDGYLKLGNTGISLVEGIKLMTETVTCLANITEFSVEFKGVPPREHLVPFLIVAWKAFGSSLRKLSFEVTLKDLAVLLSTADGLISLTDLEVTVNGEEFVDIHSEVLATALAPFVNKVAPTLHSLSYSSSSEHLDPSPFFQHLGKIPNLERLRLFIEYYGNVLTEPLAVTRFICNHATTLRHLEWDQDHGPSGEQYMMSLLYGNYLKDVFSNLCTLRIRIPNSPGGFSLVLQHIWCSADTLTSLGLHDYQMTNEEVNAVISLFTPHSAGNLKELSLWIELLSPEHILLFAQTLPSLERLAIIAVNVAGASVGNVNPIVFNADSSQNPHQRVRPIAGIFADNMRTYDMCGWALRDIDIQVAAWDRYQAMRLMWVFAECVPSVQTFCGQDKDSELYRVNPIDRL